MKEIILKMGISIMFAGIVMICFFSIITYFAQPTPEFLNLCEEEGGTINYYYFDIPTGCEIKVCYKGLCETKFVDSITELKEAKTWVKQ